MIIKLFFFFKNLPYNTTQPQKEQTTWLNYHCCRMLGIRYFYDTKNCWKVLTLSLEGGNLTPSANSHRLLGAALRLRPNFISLWKKENCINIFFIFKITSKCSHTKINTNYNVSIRRLHEAQLTLKLCQLRDQLSQVFEIHHRIHPNFQCLQKMITIFNVIHHINWVQMLSNWYKMESINYFGAIPERK